MLVRTLRVLLSVFALLSLAGSSLASAVAVPPVQSPPAGPSSQPARGEALWPAAAPPNTPAFAPGRLIVKLRPGVEPVAGPEGMLTTGRPALDAVLASQQVQSAVRLFPAALHQGLAGASSLAQVYLLQLPTDGDVLQSVAALAQDSGVEWAEPDYLAYPAAVPNDPLFPEQWALAQIQAPAAWDVVTGTSAVVIAVLDTGIDLDHPDLAGRLWANPGETPGNGLDDDGNGYVDDVRGWNFIAGTNEVDDDDGHGTQVAGVAAAETNNGSGVAGVCWNCRLMTVKVMQAGGVANYSDVARGVTYAAAKGAEVINLSLGGYANSNTLREAIEAAAGTTVIVAAAGDDGTSAPFYPAAYPDVLAVGGTTAADARAAFSNYGDWVDVAAPAVAITTTLDGGSYGSASGTSLAAPLAAGLAGLVWSQHPAWSAALVRAQVLHTTDAIGATGLGHGRINAAAAVTQEPHPLLAIAATAIDGDPLGRPAPGSGSALAVTLGNEWLDATGVTGTLTTADPFVTIVTGTAAYGDIAAGATGTGTPVYSLTVASGVGYNHPIPFTLHLSADQGAYTATLPLTITTRAANQNVGGSIVVNTTWTNDKTYIVVSNVGIAPGVTLTIQPGTMVRFNGDYSLNVGGTLVADGTAEQPIVFQPHSTSNWNRIFFDHSASVVYLSDLTYYSHWQASGVLQLDKSLNGTPITIGGIVFAKGLGTHASSVTVYDLGNAHSYLSFKTWVGHDVESGCGDGMIFKVSLGNGAPETISWTRVWTSTAQLASGLPERMPGISVQGHRWLRLETDMRTNNQCDHADWASPRLTISGSNTPQIIDADGTYHAGTILRHVRVLGSSNGLVCNESTPYLSAVTLDSGGISCMMADTDFWLLDSAAVGGVEAAGPGYVWRDDIDGNLSVDGLADILTSTVSGDVAIEAGSTIRASTIHHGTLSAEGAVLVQENTVRNGSIAAGDGAAVLTNTVLAGSISVGSGSLVSGNNVERSPGWGISASGEITLTHNRIVGCSSGMSAGGGWIQGNLIANSAGIGLQISGGTVVSNTLTGNVGDAVVIAAGTPVFHGNNLEGNRGAYDLVNNTANPIDASGNWWGTTDNEAIGVRVYDYWDNYTLGQVTYTPPQSSPVTSAPAYIRSVTILPDTTFGVETGTFLVSFSQGMDLARDPSLYFHTVRKGTWQTYNVANSDLPDDTVRSIGVDTAGDRWIGTWTEGVAVLRIDGTWDIYNSSNSGLACDSVVAMLLEPSGDRWFGSAYCNGVSLWRTDGSWQVYNTGNSGLPNNTVVSLGRGKFGEMWFGTYGSGVAVMRADGSWETYDTSNSPLTGNWVLSIMVDDAGNAWFACGGVSILRPDGTWTIYDTSNSGLASNTVLAIVRDPTGARWIGTSAGVSVFDASGTWRTYDTSNSGLINNYVEDIVLDGAGNRWFSTHGGVSVLHADGTWQSYTTGNSGLAENQVYNMAASAAGDIWFGTNVSGASVLWGGEEYAVADTLRWLDPAHYGASYEFTGLLPRDTYVLVVSDAQEPDGMEVAPSSVHTFTVDYIGDPETRTPPAPIVQACASPLTTTLSAQWSVPTTQTLSLYRYAVGTAPGLADVTTWVTTTLTAVERANLNLLPGQTYYLSVKARNNGGIWSAAGASNGVVAGAGVCPGVDFTALPTSGMAPLPVAFTATITGTETTRLWSFGDGVTSTLPNPVHTYAAGLYTVTLDVWSPSGWTTAVKGSYITVVPDTVPPAGALVIDTGAAYATETAVLLEVTAGDPSGMDDMRFSNDGISYSAWISYTANTSWTLTAGDGPKTVYAQVRDVPGNIATYTDTIILDTTPPTATVLPLPPFVGSATFTVTWTGHDAYAGLDSYDVQFREGAGGVWTDWLTATTQTAALFTGTHGQTYYFRARARDILGHLGAYAPGDGDSHTTVDLLPPAGSVLVNGAAPYANVLTVTLHLTATDLSGVAAFQSSNDGLTYSDWISFSPNYSWTLTAGDVEKTVYVRFRDLVGHESDPVSDTIVLDSVPPTGTVVVNGDTPFTAGPAVTLTLSAGDLHGIAGMAFSNDGVTFSGWVPYTTTAPWTLLPGDGLKPVYARFRDPAGNLLTVSDTIVLDTTPPTGSVVVNGDAPFTAGPAVTLTLSAGDLHGIAGMAFSNDGVTFSGWVSYTTTAPWTLLPGDGQKTVYARFRDPAGNLLTVSDTIVLDTTPPTGSVVVNGDAPFTAGPAVTLTLSAGDLHGIAGMAFSNDGITFTGWVSYTTTYPWTLLPGDGAKTIHARFRDPAGNVVTASDAIVLDTTPPTTTAAPAGLPGDNGWWRSPLQVTLAATDTTSAVDYTAYQVDGGAWLTYTGPFSVTGEGVHTLAYASVDIVGNAEITRSEALPIDTRTPTTTAVISGTPGQAGWYVSSVQVALDAVDDTAGVAAIYYRLDSGGWQPYSAAVVLEDGVYTLDYYAVDLAGNAELPQGITVSVDTIPPVAAVDYLPPYQQALTFTVSWAGDDALSGIASFDLQARMDDGAWSDWLTATTALSSTFAGFDGHTFSFRARAHDAAGNQSEYAAGYGDTTTHVDTARPMGLVAINGGAVDTTGRDVTLVLLANEETQVAFSDDGANFTPWEPFAATRAYQLPAGEGVKTVYVRYCCSLQGGIRSYSDSIMVNTVVPGDYGLSINNDAPLTDRVTVTLTLKAPPGTRQMMLSNSSRFVAAEWEPYAITRTWVLAYYPGVEVYQVYARFRSVDGGIGERFDDIITLDLLEPPPPIDGTPPSGSMVINAGAETTAVPTVTLDLLAWDNPGGVGVYWMYFREWKYAPLVGQWQIVRSSDWLPYADSAAWVLAGGTGTKYVGAWFADGAQNVSNPSYLDSINLVLPGDVISETQVTQYRETFEAGQVVTVTLYVTAGDADLYIWRPGSAGMPDYWSNLPGTATERLVFTAVAGEYLIEVHGYTSSVYTLDIATSGPGGGRQEQAAPMALRWPALLGKPLPAHPLVTTRPGGGDLPAEPEYRIFLPLVLRTTP